MRQPRPQGDPGQSPERHNGHLEAFPISLQIPFSSEEDKIKINWSWWCPQRDSKQLPDPSFVGLDIKNLTQEPQGARCPRPSLFPSRAAWGKEGDVHPQWASVGNLRTLLSNPHGLGYHSLLPFARALVLGTAGCEHAAWAT